ncbi:MAG: prepilin-type N-terminal cleavage/methylation domain-containing protein, partial [Deltaproteobacteria bacterium]|nr:prepilin-type N-terminal cleavage/methylation domain-containing protein [Deltaproteobacteria bacterium]
MMKSIKGFTLVELIITIALVAIIGVIAGFNVYAYTLNRNLKSAARAITSDFSFCKGKAISENTRYQIAFDVAGKSYTIQ